MGKEIQTEKGDFSSAKIVFLDFCHLNIAWKLPSICHQMRYNKNILLLLLLLLLFLLINRNEAR